MAIFRTGDMWSRYNDAGLFLITTNNVLNRQDNFRLVMGGGIAQQARDRFPGIDLAFGQAIWSILSDSENKVQVREDYCLLISKHWPNRKLGAFQTKRHYKNDSILSLVEDSTRALKWWSIYHSDTLVCLPFPGIGLGNLKRDAVYPIVEKLPDNVEVWEYE